MQKVQDALMITQFMLVTSNIVLNIFMYLIISLTLYRSSILAWVWSCLNELTLLTMHSMIAINVPGYARIITKAILSLSQYNIIPTDPVYALYLSFDEMNDGPLNENFNQLGYASMNSLRTLGATYMYLEIILLVYLAFIVIKVCSMKLVW